MKFSSAGAWVLGGLLPAVAIAADRLGPTYPIGEEAADQFIMRQLQQKLASGELARLQSQAALRSLQSAKHPPAVAGIAKATTYRTATIDPSITYREDVRNDQRQVIVKAGTTINPLEVMPLTKTLVFFDGSDADQVAAVRRFIDSSRQAVKPILVAGSWFDLSRRWKRQVFHDQMGELTRRFNITAVPATLRQQGRQLILEEIPVRQFKAVQ